MKKTLRNILAISMVALTGVVTLGCGSKTKADVDSLAAIKEKGKLVVGLSADYSPYEFHMLDENGEDKIVGFDVKIAEEIAKDMGVELEIKDMEFGTLITTIPNGKIDLIISGMTPDEERQKAVDFSDIYYIAEQGIIVRAEDKDKYKNFEDLEGLKVGAQMGSIQAGLVQDNIKDVEAQLLTRVSDLVLGLKSGKMEALVVEVPVAEMIVKNNPELFISEETVKDEEGGSAIAMKKDSPELAAQVNSTIKRIKEEGLLDKFIIEANELATKEVKAE